MSVTGSGILSLKVNLVRTLVTQLLYSTVNISALYVIIRKYLGIFLNNFRKFLRIFS